MSKGKPKQAGGAKLWGGRFEGDHDPGFWQFNRSLPFDKRLVQQDLEGSIAWAQALGDAEVLSKREVTSLQRALRALGKRIAEHPELLDESEAEDVHAFVEQSLGQDVGPLARKLHTGRSRNDQVATDLLLWLRRAVTELEVSVTTLQKALVELAERHPDLPVPGYTHLQRAQPITAGHHALAYAEMLERDKSRLQDALARMQQCPLGSGALAGTAFPVDRRALAKALDFEEPTRNSLDAVSNRDHVCDVLYACSLVMTHLSRLAEDWIFLASHEARLLAFGDDTSTGSSLMPQKKNPDAMELIRGKVGRVTGHLQALLTTLKGLPLAYDKDLQEDKEALFDAIDQTRTSVEVCAVVVRGIRYDEQRCRAACEQGYLNATDLADLLVANGVPFRDAHERVGIAVRKALTLGVELQGLPAAVQEELFPELTRSLDKELAVDKVLARRRAIGGTAPTRVRAEVKSWKKRLDRQK